MKTKILAGSVIGAAAVAFWACGEGTINEFSEQEEIVKVQYVETENAAWSLCQDTTIYRDTLTGTVYEVPVPGLTQEYKVNKCLLAANPNANGTEVEIVVPSQPSSSSRTPIEQPESSSSRDDNVIIRPKSSTSAPIIDTTVNPVSSSAVMEEIKGLAACAPVLQAGQTGIDKGTAAKWKITPNSKSGFLMSDYLKADVVWNFAGEGINTTTETLVGVNGPEVTYTNSGDFPATATITMGMKTETVACTPLHVNGFPISGCKCAAAAEKVDIALGEVGTWAVSSCQSQAAIIGYEWNGTDPGMTGESATLTFTEKNVVATPTVTVINDDNTKATFECAAVMSTNSDDPDYKLSFEGNQVPSNEKVYVDVPTGKEACVQVSFDWTGTWVPNGGISMKCDLKVSDNVSGLKMDITYNGKTTSFKGDYNISNEGISLGSVTQGLNNKGDVCITATVNGSPTSARCYFSN